MKGLSDWVYGSLLVYPDGECNIFTEVTGKPYRLKNWNVEPSTIGQYTSLRDCNGKEIYEGDVVTVNGKYPKLISFIEEESAFCMANISELNKQYLYPWQRIRADWWNDYHREIEIIGNIHDNPDLLEKYKND